MLLRLLMEIRSSNGEEDRGENEMNSKKKKKMKCNGRKELQ